MNTFPRYLIAALILVCSTTVVDAGADSIRPAPEATQTIPWSEVGAKAGATETNPTTRQYEQSQSSLRSKDWHFIRGICEANRYTVRRAGNELLTAYNQSQQWLTRFDSRGFLSSPNTGEWVWGLELKSYGFATNENAITELAQASHDQNRVTYDRGHGLEEWFINDSSGLEHGFTLHARPHGEGGPLGFTMATKGGLQPELRNDGQMVSFKDSAGVALVTYGGLKVWDAKGRILPSRFEVTATRALRLTVNEDGACYPLTIDPVAQQTYFKASNSGPGDQFGYSVAISGDTMVVGAYSESSSATGVNGNQADNGAIISGAAYVFVRNGPGWIQQAYLKASNTESVDSFGYSVSISGDIIVVGAPKEKSNAVGINGNQSDNSATDAGAAYVFVRNGTTWTQEAYLKASNTVARQVFGHSVSVSGNTIAVGAWGEGANSAQSGATYVFVRSGTIWSQQALLRASNPGSQDAFGIAVALSGNRLVVGAQGESSNATGVNGDQSNNNANQSGAAYVFVRSDSTWSQQAYLKASNTSAGDSFGRAVAISGDTVVIGAYSRDLNGADSGAAYVFVDSSGWSQQAYLTASNAEALDRFGWSVAVNGNTLIVGAPEEDGASKGINGTENDNSASKAGAAYVFLRSGGVWNQYAYLKASNTEAGDEFGWSVAASDNLLLVGAYREDSSATGLNGLQTNNSYNSAGAVYSFGETVLAPTPPVVKTLSATAITHNSATLNGLVNAKGSARAVAFDYGLTTAYGASVNASPASVDGSADTPVSVGITGLLPHTKYNFRVRAAGAQGAANGTNMTFTTLNRAPVATGETVMALPSAKVTIPVLSNDADPDGDALSIADVSPLAASVGTIAKVGTDLVFTPSATFAGGSITYTASDALGLKSNAATVTLQLADCTLGPDVTIPADSPPYDLTVSATAPWTVIESFSWLSFVPPAPGATSVRFVPAPNPSKDSRIGTVKIGGKTHTVTQSGVLVAPVLTTPAPIPNAAISANYDLIIPTLNGPVTYTTTGMPKGLALSNVTGRITGYPIEAKTSTVTVKAKNVRNDSNTISFNITVLPFPPSLVGSYSASIADSETLTDKLGGLMTMTVTNTGGVTGTLKLGAGSHSFTSRLNTAVNPLAPDPDHAVLKVSVKRTGKPAVDLTVNMNSASTDLIAGDVTLPGAVPVSAALAGSKHVWHATSKPADAFKGYFTAALEPTNPSASIPQGDGFLTFSVSASGAVSWSGQLADGTTIATQNATLWANGEIPLFTLLYGSKGSLSQRISIASGTKVVSGSPHWHKKSQATRAYAGGFDPTTLTAIGAEYLPPGAGQTLLNIAAPGSASIDFIDGGIGSVSQFIDLDQVFNVSATHAATFTAVNPAQVKLTKLDVVKGTFTGSLTLKDINPFNVALPLVIRPVNFNGVLLPASGKGTGYFLLPGITGPPANVTTSPMTSGRVEITP